MSKLVIINHTFQKPQFYKRWEIFAAQHRDFDITLLAPGKWEWGKSKTLTYGKVEAEAGRVVEQDNFHIHLIDVKDRIMGEYSSKDLEEELLRIQPDLTYFIGGHTAYPLMQILRLRDRHRSLKDMKVIAFSMRGHTPTIDYKKSEPGVKKYLNTVGKVCLLGPRLYTFNHKCDAVFCHYPAALEAFRAENYTGPIYMQTQVGVDPDVFYPDPDARQKLREKYRIGDAFLFGSASRFHYSKGISQIVQALPKEGNWKYLMMGWGRDDEVEAIRNEIAARNLDDKIILTGYIDNWTDMAEHWNSLDCAIHAPLTTPHWEETFSLALVQAMITGLPVIGSSSGSVPYQMGPDGIIIPEGDVDAMNQQMIWLMEHPDEGRAIGLKMRQRALDCFSIYHLNDLFYLTVMDILHGIYDKNKVDMAKFVTDDVKD